ncbi:MAG TPA: hypothetical protein VKT82_03280 [Ktedonobacterales bacterium]|nr:hypothetical protein [Ktedonobacterales bacterium]
MRIQAVCSSFMLGAQGEEQILQTLCTLAEQQHPAIDLATWRELGYTATVSLPTALLPCGWLAEPYLQEVVNPTFAVEQRQTVTEADRDLMAALAPWVEEGGFVLFIGGGEDTGHCERWDFSNGCLIVRTGRFDFDEPRVLVTDNGMRLHKQDQ